MEQTNLRIQILWFLLMFKVQYGQSYHLECPRAVQWKLRAKRNCNNTNNPDKYYCLENVLKQQYVEGCTGPDWDRKGSKRVISGDFTRGKCSKNRFQPFDFWTNGTTDCVYSKSLCSEEGQVINSNGSGYVDTTCRCDFDRGYNYAKLPEDLCNCRPFIEDCTCVQEKCCNETGNRPTVLNCSGHVLYNQKPNQYDTHRQEMKDPNTVLVRISSRYERTVVTCLTALALAAFIMLWIFFVHLFPQNLYETGFHKLVYQQLYERNRTENKDQNVDSSGDCTDFEQNEHSTNIVGDEMNNESKKSNEYHTRDKDKSVDTSGDGTGHVCVKDDSVELSPSVKSMITREEVNYLRIVYLLYGVACIVVRMVFDNEITPKKLWQTLFEQGKMLQKEKSKKEMRKLHIFQVLNDKNLKSSKDFDLNLMIHLLKEMEIFQIGDQLPLPYDNRIDALLGRIKYYRDIIVYSVNGKLNDDNFMSYWKDISQAILRLSSHHFSRIAQERSLREKILVLSPVQKDDIKLHQFAMLTDGIPQTIFQQVIKEYCQKSYSDNTVITFLKEEMHNLFHKRKNQSYCCECLDKRFSFVLPNDLWNKLYMTSNNAKKACKCDHPAKCFQECVINFNFQLTCSDTSLLISLVMNVPKLMRYMTKHFSIRLLLEREKHIVYHMVEQFSDSVCCQCAEGSDSKKKYLLSQSDWNQLFMQKNESSCNVVQCCCKYSVKENIKVEDVDDNLLYKVMSVAGPIHIFDKANKNPLDSFLCWDGIGTKYTEGNRKLLEAVHDMAFKKTLERRLSKYETIHDEDFISKWILRNVTGNKANGSPKTESVIVFEHQGKIEVKNMFLSHRAKVNISQKQKIFEPEEMNFLRLTYLLYQMVCPYLRKKFDEKLSGNLREIISELYYECLTTHQTPNKKTEGKVKVSEIHLNSIQCSTLFKPKQVEDGVTSGELDLTLILEILKFKRHSIESLKDDDKIYENMDIIEDIRKAIAKSKDGRLSESEFQKNWQKLSEVCVYLGGEELRENLRKLKTQEILTGFD